MTGTAASARREWWPWMGHNAWRLQFGVFVAWTAGLFAPPVLTLVILGVGIPIYIALAVFEHAHERKLCEACIAAWPLDPQGEVERYRRWLHMEHRWDGGSRRRLAAFGALVIAYSVIILVLTLALPAFSWPTTIWLITLYGFLIASGYARHIHHRLEPWCPWCHRGRGGDHFNPDPVTPPSVKADR